ncbi:hypothetical protein [Enterobacter mori]|uniref:hypothetical protein n=1 Tax=Enterobacter mori TaxID=539813 RepID=UPI002DBB0F6F|nr:hypothetical protein [Enterobacter mori]MEB7917482.1 hypothetical protein [Enterobacter mori]
MKENFTFKKIVSYLVIALIIASPIITYYCNVKGHISSKNEDWGDFGSFIGGIYGSIFSSLSLMVVLWATVETKRSSSEQLKIIKNDQHSNEFKILMSHLEENRTKTYRDMHNSIQPIERHIGNIFLMLRISTLQTYNHELSIHENLKINAINYYSDPEHNYFEVESKLLSCILNIVDSASESSSRAFKVIFETSFPNDFRHCIEMHTRALYGSEVNKILDQWPTFSCIPQETVESAERNAKKKG